MARNEDGRRVTGTTDTTTGPGESYRLSLTVLGAVSAVLLALRLFASNQVGFGDAESLYASYALHPQAAYLDHPGLIGVFARVVGRGTAPSPQHAHQVTSFLATLVPWVMALACRAAGAPWSRAFAASIAVALAPEIAVGLFAMTPDLLLALAWTGAIALAAVGLRAPAGHPRATLAFSAAGLLAGVGAAAKVTGVLLMAALAFVYGSRTARAHGRTLAPWAGLAAGAFVLIPVLAFEMHTGWPMLRHRLIDTQPAPGFSLRNVAAFLGGQVLYLSPLVAFWVVAAARTTWCDRQDPVGSLLLMTSAVPACVLVPLCLWSRVAEPHWMAPALLALAPAAARAAGGPSRRALVVASTVAGGMVAAVHAWVLVPASALVAPTDSAKLDIANELYGWPDVTRAVLREVRAQWTPDKSMDDVAVVAPHWVLCAQLEAALGGDVAVGCDSPFEDDFDTWWPRKRWRSADTIVWVTDERFAHPPDLPAYATIRSVEVRVVRAGRAVRVFTIRVFYRRALS